MWKWNIKYNKREESDLKHELIDNKLAQHKEQWARSDYNSH